MSKVTQKCKFHRLQKYCNAFKLRYLIGPNHDAISKLQSLYKVHLNTISNGEFSDPLCSSVHRGLTLVRLHGRLTQNGYDSMICNNNTSTVFYSNVT